jgi:hypothetical protein
MARPARDNNFLGGLMNSAISAEQYREIEVRQILASQFSQPQKNKPRPTVIGRGLIARLGRPDSSLL